MGSVIIPWNNWGRGKNLDIKIKFQREGFTELKKVGFGNLTYIQQGCEVVLAFENCDVPENIHTPPMEGFLV